MIRAAIILSTLAGTAAHALTPLPPCELEEGGMNVYGVTGLGDGGSGVVVEAYTNTVRLVGTVYEPQPGPVPALNGFSGVRAVHCASGQFVAFDDVGDPYVSAQTLAATELLRAKVQAGKAVTFGDLKRAVTAVYGKPITLRETEETCSCGTYYPGLWP